MSQYLTIQVRNYSIMKNIAIEPTSDNTGTTTYSTTGATSKGAELNVSYDKSKKEYTFGGSGHYNMEFQSSTSFIQKALILSSNIDDGGYGTWEYDYKASKKNAVQNAYLYGSSSQRGLYMWNTSSANSRVGALTVKVTATFGGGNKSNESIVSNYYTGAYNLGSGSTTFVVNSYNSKTEYAGK